MTIFKHDQYSVISKRWKCFFLSFIGDTWDRQASSSCHHKKNQENGFGPFLEQSSSDGIFCPEFFLCISTVLEISLPGPLLDSPLLLFVRVWVIVGCYFLSFTRQPFHRFHRNSSSCPDCPPPHPSSARQTGVCPWWFR